MADAASLELLIKILRDPSGAQLTKEDIEAIKAKFKELGIETEGVFDQVGDSSERFSFRTQHHAEMAILSLAGLRGPLANIAYHFEYLEFMAQRSGMSIEGMLAKFAPMIAVVGTVAALGKGLTAMAEEGKKDFAEVGITSNDFLENLKAGIGFVDTLALHVRSASEETKLLSASFESMKLRIKEATEQFPGLGEAQRLAHEAEVITRRGERTTKALGEQYAKLEEERTASGALTGDQLVEAFVHAGGDERQMRGFGPAQIHRFIENFYLKEMAAVDTQIHDAERNTQQQLERNAKQQNDADEGRRKVEDNAARARAEAETRAVADQQHKTDRVVEENLVKQSEATGALSKEGAGLELADIARRHAQTPEERGAAEAEYQKARAAARSAGLERLQRGQAALGAAAGDPFAAAQAMLEIEEGVSLMAQSGPEANIRAASRARYRPAYFVQVGGGAATGTAADTTQQRNFPTDIHVDSAAAAQAIQQGGQKAQDAFDSLGQTILSGFEDHARKIQELESRLANMRSM